MAELSIPLKRIGHEGRMRLKEYCDETIETLRDRLETPSGSNPTTGSGITLQGVNHDITRGEIVALRALRRQCVEIEKGPA